MFDHFSIFQDLTGISRSLVFFGVVFLIQSTLLILSGLFLSRFLRGRAALRSAVLRATLVAVLVTPVFYITFSHLGFRGVPIPAEEAASAMLATESDVSSSSTQASQHSAEKAQGVPVEAVNTAVQPAGTTTSVWGQLTQSLKEVPWKSLFIDLIAGAWVLGTGIIVLRLGIFHWRLKRLYRQGEAAPAEVANLCGKLSGKLSLQTPPVYISESVRSPFLCGVLRPRIFLPAGQEFQEKDLSGILVHELAHLKRRDCFWHFLVRLVTAVLFFQPLLWVLARRLEEASDEVCDDFVIQEGHDPRQYARLLVDLADQYKVDRMETVLGVGVVPFRSFLGQRVKRLMDYSRPLSLRTGTLALFVITAMALVGAGCSSLFGLNGANDTVTSEVEDEILSVRVQVIDEEGNPVSDAKITTYALRAKVNSGSHYGWSGVSRNGGLMVDNTSITNPKGYADAPYPKYVQEKMETGKITVSVDHPDFPSLRPPDIPVDGPVEPIVLIKGATLELSGFIGTTHQRVKRVYPIVSGENSRHKSQNWQETGNDVMRSNRISEGSHLLRIAAASEDGTIYFSDLASLEAVSGETYVYNLELKKGLSLSGTLDASVERPVKNGFVVANAHSPLEDNKPILQWRTQTPIEEDGSFKFEFIPPGKVEFIAMADGYLSKNQPGCSDNGFCYPQVFTLSVDQQNVEMKMIATSSAEITVLDDKGNPLEGARVAFWPNLQWCQRWSTTIGPIYRGMDEVVRNWANELEEDSPTFSDRSRRYSAATDEFGKAVIKNLPGAKQSLNVTHKKYEMPIQNTQRRIASIDLVPGEVSRMTVTLQEKGKEFLGEGVNAEQAPAAPCVSDEPPAPANSLTDKPLAVKEGDVAEEVKLIAKPREPRS